MDSLPEAGEVFTEFILFNIDEEEFAIDIKNVTAILKTKDFSKVVFSSNLELAQIFEYKNEIFHFQNLHKKLKHNFPAEIVGTRILLSNIDNNKTAIIVDNIKEYVTVNNKAQEFLKVVPVTDIDYIAAKITYEGRTILVPDLNKICRDELASLHI